MTKRSSGGRVMRHGAFRLAFLAALASAALLASAHVAPVRPPGGTVRPLPPITQPDFSHPRLSDPSFSNPSLSNPGLSTPDLGGYSSGGYDQGGGGAYSDTSAASEPPPPSPAEIWTARHTVVSAYGDNILLGAANSATEALARALLGAELREAPAIIVLLHPNEDAPEISAIRGAAGGADIVVIRDPATAERDALQALDRFKDRAVLLIGHVEYGRFKLVGHDGDVAGSADLDTLDERARARNIWPYFIGCGTGASAASIGTLADLTGDQIANSLPAALSARTPGAILEAFAAQTALAVSADELVNLRRFVIYRLDDFVDAYSNPSPIMQASAPPPELPRAFRIALPNGCASADDAAACEEMQASVKRYEPSVLRFWPWALGGLFVLWIGASMLRRT